MRVFLTLLILILSIQPWTKADDIRDFEIEGMSLGDSALNFFTKSEIDKSVEEMPQYPNDEYKIAYIQKSNKYNFKNIRIAGHPEGNPDDKNTEESLNEKLKLLSNNFKISIVTQFSLSASITNDWIKKTRKFTDQIGNTEIIIGLAGPSKITTLMKYAKVCGVNASASFLKKQGFDVTKLIIFLRCQL